MKRLFHFFKFRGIFFRHVKVIPIFDIYGGCYMKIMSDIEIAQSCTMKPITEIAKTAGVDSEYLELYGNYKAKVDYRLLRDSKRPDGKLILVTAINPTPAGEGKTTTTVGLADAMRRLMSRNFSAPRSAPKPASVTA